MVELLSYPLEDVHPDSWDLDSACTHQGSRYSLRLFGNTWKLESVGPMQLDTGDVWEVAARVGELGEIQGFGLVDSACSLLYAFAGTQLLDPDIWVTVYQGAFPRDTWNVYRLPVGEDWLGRFGYLPEVTHIAFINDRDSDPDGVTWFDDIADVTEDLPCAPSCSAWYEIGAVTGKRAGTVDVTVQFRCEVSDPDSGSHSFHWWFGDGATGTDSCPEHVYTVRDNHEYTVLLEVTDEDGMHGRATCFVSVDPGPTTFPVRVNFTGDVMLARRYELPGGTIDTLGVEGIFDSILPWLGDAADITVANLESPLTDTGVRHPTKSICFRGRPENIAGVAHAGIDVVSLANNHVIDYGLAGMRETQHLLDSVGIAHFGAGADAYEANLPAFRQASGVNFAFLGFCDRTGQYDNYQPFLNAGFNKPGFALMDTFQVFRQIAAIRPVADLVVLELHTGEEYQPFPGDAGAEEDEFYSPLALMPSDTNRSKRRRMLDNGADLVICHHPHVLQGFEVHDGKLIAHSLGNFAFDQEYTETYVSAILQAEVDEAGFCSYRVVPVYIDDYVPRRARGELGNHILDYLARRSRELGTYVITDRDSAAARIVLDIQQLRPYRLPYVVPMELEEDDGWWVSHPHRLPRNGSISGVVSAAPVRDWQFRLGRQVVWFGNFEDEGSTLWQLDHEDEYYDTVANRGERSLCQFRPEGRIALNTQLEEKLVCYSDSTPYTLHAWIRTDNGCEAGVTARMFSYRSSTFPIGIRNLGAEVNGTHEWQFFHREFVPEDGTGFLDVRLRSVGPDEGDGRAWFDDVGIIEWEDWRNLDEPVEVAAPNDIYWLQLRTDEQTQEAVVSFEELMLDLPTGTEDLPRAGPRPRLLEVFPNPTRSVASLRYAVSRSGPVSLKVYNPLGQEVRTLVQATQSPGSRVVSWDGRDNAGRLVGAGTFFCRLLSPGCDRSEKVVVSH